MTRPSVSHDDYESVAAAYLTARRNEAPRSTVRRAVSLKAFATWAWGEAVLCDYLLPKPERGVAHPMPGGMTDVRAMLAQARTVDQRTVIVLCSFMGLRISEARNARACHFDTDAGELLVRGKGDKSRRVPYSPETFAMLAEAYNRSRHDGGTLCAMSDSGARAMVKRIAFVSGVQKDVASHDLRATCLTEIHDRTLDLRMVADFAGHASTETTMGYVRANRESMREAVNF